MKRLNIILLRKRFILFALVCITTFMMNLFLWNETTRLIRAIPELNVLQAKSTEEVYEIDYMPKTAVDGRVIDYSENEKKIISDFLITCFFESENHPMLCSGIQDYTDSQSKALIPVKKEDLKNMIESSQVDSSFWRELAVTHMTSSQATVLRKNAEKLNLKIGFVSLKERFKSSFNYYVGNFVFGMIVSVIFLSFSVLLIYLTISSSLKILKQDIRLFRIIGVSNKKIIANFSTMFFVLIIVTALLFLVFIHTLGVGVIPADYLYLFLLNLTLILFGRKTIKKKVWWALDA
ncbi:hypothetical protein [Pseudolactococcus yaeyamensis]